MDNFNWLLQGFAEAATPMNLMYAVIGVLLGTAVGVLPGIGRDDGGAAVADHLQRPPECGVHHVRRILDGGMYGGSTTSIRSIRRVSRRRWSPPSKATRWPRRAARRRPWRPRRSDRSSGRHRHRSARGVRAVDIAIRGDAGCPVLPGDHAVGAGDGDRGAGLIQAARRHLAAARAGDRQSASTRSPGSRAPRSGCRYCPTASTSW